MDEEPDLIRRNIEHYQQLLTRSSETYTHENVRKILAEALVQLSLARARAFGRGPS